MACPATRCLPYTRNQAFRWCGNMTLFYTANTVGFMRCTATSVREIVGHCVSLLLDAGHQEPPTRLPLEAAHPCNDPPIVDPDRAFEHPAWGLHQGVQVFERASSPPDGLPRGDGPSRAVGANRDIQGVNGYQGRLSTPRQGPQVLAPLWRPEPGMGIALPDDGQARVHRQGLRHDPCPRRQVQDLLPAPARRMQVP